MLIRSKIKAIVITWLAAEVAALAAAVHVWGWPATILIGFLTSALGFHVLRQAGRESIDALRQAMRSASGLALEAPSGSLVRILAGLLLVMPGFLSDLAGLVLLWSPVRERLVRRFATGSASRHDGILDLDPDEWRASRAHDAEPSCEPLPGMLPGEPKSRTDQETGR